MKPVSSTDTYLDEVEKRIDALNEFCENKGCRAMPGSYCNISFAEQRRIAGAYHPSRVRKAKRRLK
jgi:hypothetical protein